MATRKIVDNQAEIVERLKKASTSVLSDVMDRVGKRGCMSSSIKPLSPGLKIAGPAVTVKRIRKPHNIGEEDFKEYRRSLHQMIDNGNAGDIFVVAAEGETESANWGGLTALAAMQRKLGGAVIDGGVRDSVEISEMGFPIFMRSIFPGSPAPRLTTVGINVPVICGDILVHPGDMVVGDDDGVIVIPRDRAEEIVRMAEEIEETEGQMVEYLKQGHTLIETFNKYRGK